MARSIVSIESLRDSEIDGVFTIADEFVERLGEPGRPHRVRGRLDLADQNVFASVFFEPSTRTRLSFESAMHRLGGRVISADDPRTTSAAKGETIADTIRMLQGYADLIVMRHPWEGAAAVAAEFAEVPVVNAGDGGHEHPTQTLCDLYTLRRERGSLRNLNVLLCGDLRYGRTVHSLVQALVRLGARVITSPAPGFELPGHVHRRLCDRYGAIRLDNAACAALGAGGLPVDAMYVVPDAGTSVKDPAPMLAENPPHERIDALYVTRAQTERLRDGESGGSYPVIGLDTLSHPPFQDAIVMHPLPRVTELDYALDNDPRGFYFKQASYGVPVRMALLSALLGIRPALEDDAPTDERPVVTPAGLCCPNDHCVSNQPSERRYLRPRFRQNAERLECVFCDWEVVASTARCVPGKS